MAKKKQHLKFDKRGGVLIIGRRLMNSEAYSALRPASKVLMLLMQEHWSNDKPVSFSVREAAKKIPCDTKTAQKCFNALMDVGFIECTNQSDWLRGKARNWRLTWMPYTEKEPTNEWEKWRSEIKPTVGKTTTYLTLFST